MRRRAVLLLTLMMTVALLMLASPAWAKDFTVTSTGEGGDDDPGDGVCDTAIPFVRTCTLRAAIEEANANGEADRITFSSALSGPITLTNGQLQIANDTSGTLTDDLIIEGPGASTLTVSGNDASRVFEIAQFADATISGLTISDGSSNLGGGISNAHGALTLTDSTVSGNSARTSSGGLVFGTGGGIYNTGTMTLTDSTVSGNFAVEGGGGIRNEGAMTLTNSTVSTNSTELSVGTSSVPGATSSIGGGINNACGALTLTNSTVSGNSVTVSASDAIAKGGGIANGDCGALTLTNSTVSGNSVTATGTDSIARGGGIAKSDFGGADGPTLTLTNSTVSGNSVTASGAAIGTSITASGGGIYIESGGPGDLLNTIVARNTATTNFPDAEGEFMSGGNNLIGNTTGSSGWGTTDLQNVNNPLLGPLQDNGGPTLTHALHPGSPAVDAANATNCPESGDQRGVARKDGDKNGSVICDIGAFERNDLTPPKVTPPTTPTAKQTGVGLNTDLSANFSERMSLASLSTSTFKLYKVNRDGSTTQIKGVSVSSTEDGLKATLNLNNPLRANTRYKAVVTTGAKDRVGNRLDQNRKQANNQPMEWFFTTGSS